MEKLGVTSPNEKSMKNSTVQSQFRDELQESLS